MREGGSSRQEKKNLAKWPGFPCISIWVCGRMAGWRGGNRVLEAALKRIWGGTKKEQLLRNNFPDLSREAVRRSPGGDRIPPSSSGRRRSGETPVNHNLIVIKLVSPSGRMTFHPASFTVERPFRRGEKDAKAARPEPGWRPPISASGSGGPEPPYPNTLSAHWRGAALPPPRRGGAQPPLKAGWWIPDVAFRGEGRGTRKARW